MQSHQTENEQKLRQHLVTLSQSTDDLFMAETAQIILDESDGDASTYLSAVCRYGCISGWVGALVYYSDTHAFFDRHYDTIDDLRMDYEQATGQPLQIIGDLKNSLAWFAFEKTAYSLMCDFQIFEP